MNRNRKRVYVRRKWDSPVDIRAYRLTYGQWRGGYVEARREWNETVTKWSSEGALGEFERMRLLSCRVRGVTLSKPSPRFSCHHPFCPSCRYSWTSKLLRKFPPWLIEGPLDLALWQSPVREKAVMDETSAAQHRFAPCRVMRKTIAASLGFGITAEGFHNSRMFVTFDEKNHASYFHQLLFVGRNFPPAYLTKAQLGSTYLEAFNGISAGSALNALKYCRAWLELQHEIGVRVGQWNAACRSRVYSR